MDILYFCHYRYIYRKHYKNIALKVKPFIFQCGSW
uniref:Uncharacterized protein n=1 Tax=Anguilla anguilla TaxID=7936 RepID=A0A0E9VHG0_ANGAN